MALLTQNTYIYIVLVLHNIALLSIFGAILGY